MADNTGEATTSSQSVMKDMAIALKTPSVWVVAIVIFTIYATYSASSYMQPYCETVLGMSAVAAGYVGILRKDAIRLLGAPISGFISEKMGGRCALLIGIFDILFIIFSGNPSGASCRRTVYSCYSCYPGSDILCYLRYARYVLCYY